MMHSNYVQITACTPIKMLSVFMMLFHSVTIEERDECTALLMQKRMLSGQE